MMVYLSVMANKPTNQCSCGRLIYLGNIYPQLVQIYQSLPRLFHSITFSETKEKCKACDTWLNQHSTLVSPILEYLE